MSKGFFVYLSIIFFLTTTAFAGEAPYNPNQSPTRPLFCFITDPQNHSTYFSSIFVGNTKNLYSIQDAYLHFVAKKYGYKIQAGVDQWHMPVECQASQDTNVLKTQKATRMEDEAYKAYKAVDTEWTFESAHSVEEKTATASSSASPNGAAPQDEKVDAFTMATLQQDPRGLNLSPLDRQFVMSEVPKAKSYCAKDPELSQSLDCTCFIRTVFNYRIAHASGPIQQTNFPPLATVLTKPDFSCTECVNKNHSGQVSCDRGNHPH